MRKTISYTLAFCLLGLLIGLVFADATSWNIKRKPNEKWLSGAVGDPAWNWMKEVDKLVSIGANPGTGRVFYVDSGVTTEGGGTSWETAKDTLDEAIALCTAARGDIILVAQGHQEVKAAAGDIFTLDIAGVTVKGVSNGAMSGPVASGAATLSLMPVFILDHASATATISAPNCRISGLRFESDVIDNAIGLTISAAADGYIVDNCVFRDGAAAEEMVIAISVAADADEGRIAYNTFSTYPAGGCANAILLAGGSDDTIIEGNVANGTYSAGAFLATAASSRNLTFIGNTFCNQGAIAVDLNVGTTGIMRQNYLAGTTSIAAALTDVDAMWLFENYVSGEDNKSGLLDPLADGD